MGGAVIGEEIPARASPGPTPMGGNSRSVGFETFVAAELPGLARYARVLTGNREHAHDVLADALVRAQMRWKRIGDMEFPVAYVRRMITTGYLAERRRWSARHVTPVATLPERPAVDPVGPVDDRSVLNHLLVGLPRTQRAAIVMRFYLDLSDDEIARDLGCSPGAVRSYVSKGLAAMRVDQPSDPEAGGPK